MLISPRIKDIVRAALQEDIGRGDITTTLLVDGEKRGEAVIFAKDDGVIAGLDLVREVFLLLDKDSRATFSFRDGDAVKRGDNLGRISATLAALLSGERTALNFLQHLSGIASRTAGWINILEDYSVALVDTRKTTPGLRELEKYAVRTGGGRNHRLDLSGGVLIKENHIRAAGNIFTAVSMAVKNAPVTVKVEVEVTNTEELKEALRGGAHIVMLDNMDTETIKEAVAINGGRALLEVSGNVTEERLAEIAATGVDYISCGALTHSAPALDISMLIVPES